MTLFDDIARELPVLREQAESRMVDEWALMVSLGMEYDPEVGEEVEQFALLFNTKARVKVVGGLAVREAEVGARTSVQVVREFHIPVTSAAVPTGAVAFPISIHETSDPTLVDTTLRLDGPAPGSQTTARRLQVSEVLT